MGQGQGERSRSPGPGNHVITLTVKGSERHYLLHIPPAYDGLTPLSVVLMFHGTGGTGRWAMGETGWADRADREGFLAVFPEGTGPHPEKPVRFVSNPPAWNDGSGRGAAALRHVDDVGFINALLDDLSSRLAVDENRVYMTGFSNGAAMAFRVGAELSSRVAALAPVSGLCWVEEPKLERPVPTLFLVGTADPLVPLEGGEVRTPWGDRDRKPPVWDSLRKWAEALGCPPEPEVVRDRDGVKVVRYGPGREGSELLVYLIEGLGHHWPGGRGQLPERWAGKASARVRATEVIWEFFEKHPRR